MVNQLFFLLSYQMDKDKLPLVLMELKIQTPIPHALKKWVVFLAGKPILTPL